MSNYIVDVAVSQTTPPAPSRLQGTGAFVAQGATTAADGSLTLITEAADLTPILKTAAAITSITWGSNTATVNCTAAHGIPTGQSVRVTLAGQTPSGYSGTFTATATDSDTFTVPLTPDPGACTVAGTWIPASVAELTGAVNTFFAQGSNVSAYVLAFDIDGATNGIADLSAWITTNPGVVYSFLVPTAWDGNANLVTLANTKTATTAKTYFFVPTTTSDYTDYADIKSVLTMVPSPDATANEMPIAAMFHKTLSYAPSSANQVTPLAFSYLYGVTEYPTFGNGSTLAALKAAGANYVGTGAEGGLSNKVLFWGTTMDVRSFNYWYSVDYVQINAQRDLANAIINGSNNPAAPLYYNQDGINRLQAVLQKTMSNTVSVGLGLGSIVLTAMSTSDFARAFNNGEFAGKIAINAVPFLTYTAANPTHYALEQYDGLSVIYTPQLGFKQILLNVNASEVV